MVSGCKKIGCFSLFCTSKTKVVFAFGVWLSV
jgi:hypothetical protein